VACGHFFLQQLFGNVFSDFGQRAQLLEQGLQRSGRPSLLQRVQHIVQHGLPGGIDVVHSGQQGHGVLLGTFHGAGIQRALPRAGGLVLGVHDLGHKQQVVGDGIAVGQLAQACSASANRLATWGSKMRGRRSVQRFDFAGLKNALH
jgi:hypothetical protein